MKERNDGMEELGWGEGFVGVRGGEWERLERVSERGGQGACGDVGGWRS
jgi:hypothetical protein